MIKKTRRELLLTSGLGMAATAAHGLLGNDAYAQSGDSAEQSGLPGIPHFAPKAKRVISLFQSGGPSQLELFDHKPALEQWRGEKLPDSVRNGQRVTGMSNEDLLLIAPAWSQFSQHGQSGAWVSDLMPHIAGIADDICFLKAVNTEAINHDPGLTFFMTGAEAQGRPSIGAWVSYGLGSMNEDLPRFAVMLSRNTIPGAQPLYGRLWGSGFLPSRHQGVKLRASGDPVLYLEDDARSSAPARRKLLDRLALLNERHRTTSGDPEITTRLSAYELAFRMQTSVPSLVDLSDEPESTFDLYGPEARIPGTFARNCILARRMAERGVRFIQLFHRGWDHHSQLPRDLPLVCGEVDQPSAALVRDLAQRGLLEDTLVVWGGEFGRTAYAQTTLNAQFGRDHHGRCFTMWMAGGGIKPGVTFGQTDDFGYNIVKDGVHVHDVNATILHLLGVDHLRLTYRHKGRDFRLTDVGGRVISDILA